MTNSRVTYHRRTSCGADGDSNQVLSYAQVEAGAVHDDMQPVSLEDVLTTCDALVAPQVRHQNLALVRAPCDPALTVRADREKLQQIVLNLLSNAIEFTRAGGQIMLRCACGADRDGSLLQIVVTDTGIGVEPSQLGRIFEPFVRVNTPSRSCCVRCSSRQPMQHGAADTSRSTADETKYIYCTADVRQPAAG